MKEKIKIFAPPEQLKEGLFGQIFLFAFEILPELERQNIFPEWEICSALYGTAPDFVVIPGLLELNYEPAPGAAVKKINLQDFRDEHAVTLGNDWEYVSALWHKFFRLPARVISRADEFPTLKNALGLHFRGTDKNKALTETNHVSEEIFLRLVRDFVETHPDIQAIFIATDENAFVEKVRAQHPQLPVFNSGKVTHHKVLDEENNFAKGDHALLDCLLLSYCKYLLKCQSALSGFAKILNPKLEAWRVSANKLFTWDIPYFPDAFLPKLTSKNDECQKILERLFEGDWTMDAPARKKYPGIFRHQKRKSYMRKDRGVPKWSFDGLRLRIDRRVLRLRRRLNF